MIHSAKLREIERAISRERLKRYLAATRNNLALAVALYGQNMALSQAVFGLLHGLEIAIRNRMHETLTLHFGTPRWFLSENFVLTPYGKDKIAGAVRDAGGPSASPGKVVAEFTFGFWCNLAARAYHWSRWQPCLRRTFSFARISRPVAPARLEAIRTLRNRIAHHEPVLTSNRSLYAGSGLFIPLTGLDGCAGWPGPELSTWLRTGYRYTTAAAILDQVADSGIVL